MRTFTIVVDTSGLNEGVNTLEGEITKRNAITRFSLLPINVDNIPPVITFVSPQDGLEVSGLPTIHATYADGTGTGIASAAPGAISVALTRLMPPNEVAVDVDQTAVHKSDDSLVYTREQILPGGAYRATV